MLQIYSSPTDIKMYKVRIIGDTTGNQQFQLPRKIILHPELAQFENDIAIVTVRTPMPSDNSIFKTNNS